MVFNNFYQRETMQKALTSPTPLKHHTGRLGHDRKVPFFTSPPCSSCSSWGQYGGRRSSSSPYCLWLSLFTVWARSIIHKLHHYCSLKRCMPAFEDHYLCQLASCNLAHCLLLHRASLGGVALFGMGPRYHTASWRELSLQSLFQTVFV